MNKCYTTSNGPLLLLKLRENGCYRVLYINGFLFKDCQCCFVFSQIWQAWIQRSHTSKRRSQHKWNYLWSGDCAEMDIHPDWNETGNPGTQNILLKQFNKKIVKFLEKLEKPKAYRVCHLSHKETQLSKKIFKFNTNFIQRKCEKILPYAKSNYASQIRPARLFLTQLQFTNILFSLFSSNTFFPLIWVLAGDCTNRILL